MWFISHITALLIAHLHAAVAAELQWDTLGPDPDPLNPVRLDGSRYKSNTEGDPLVDYNDDDNDDDGDDDDDDDDDDGKDDDGTDDENDVNSVARASRLAPGETPLHPCNNAARLRRRRIRVGAQHQSSDTSEARIATLTERALRAMTVGEFQARYVSASVPFVARAAASVALLRSSSERGVGDWGFLNDASIATAFGPRLARVVRLTRGTLYGLGSSVEMPYRSFCAFNSALRGGNDTDTAGLYLAQSDLSQVPQIAAEVELPRFARALVVHRAMLWIAHHNRTTPLHYDDVDNVMAVVQGTKRFTLYPPWDACALRPHALNAHLDPHEDDLEIASAYRPGDRLPNSTLVSPLVIDVNAGDVIFVPAFWFSDWYCNFFLGGGLFFCFIIFFFFFCFKNPTIHRPLNTHTEQQVASRGQFPWPGTCGSPDG
jgi:hypothetical protein